VLSDLLSGRIDLREVMQPNVDSAQCIADVTPLMMMAEKYHICQSASCPFFFRNIASDVFVAERLAK
jgi:hypothetical protein